VGRTGLAAWALAAFCLIDGWCRAGGSLHHRLGRLLVCLEEYLRAPIRGRIGVLGLSAKRGRKTSLEQLVAKARVYT
jgi:hypothetical protein